MVPNNDQSQLVSLLVKGVTIMDLFPPSQVVARCFMSAASPCLHRSVHYGSRYRDEAATLECLARKFRVSFKRIEEEEP